MESLEKSIEQLEERMADGLEEFSQELSELKRLYKLASEEGELEYVERVSRRYDPKEHSKIFTNKISELLDVLAHQKFQSVSELAIKLNRDIANVYRDLRILEELGIVSLIKVGKRVRPILLAKKICIRLDI